MAHSNLLDLKSNLDNRNSFGGSSMTAIPHGENSSINGPAVNAANDIDGGVGDTIEQQFFHGKANPGMLDGKKIGALDLHVQLLNNTYEYNRAGFAGSSGPAPGGVVNKFADLNLDIDDSGVQGDPERYVDKMNAAGLLP